MKLLLGNNKYNVNINCVYMNEAIAINMTVLLQMRLLTHFFLILLISVGEKVNIIVIVTGYYLIYKIYSKQCYRVKLTSLAAWRNHSLAVSALVMVSWVVNV